MKSRESCETIASDFSPARCSEPFSSVSVTSGFVPLLFPSTKTGSHDRETDRRRARGTRGLVIGRFSDLTREALTARYCCTIYFASGFRCASRRGAKAKEMK